MCSSAVCTVLPCGSSTAFLGVIMTLAFMGCVNCHAIDAASLQKPKLRGEQIRLSLKAMLRADTDVADISPLPMIAVGETETVVVGNVSESGFWHVGTVTHL